MSANNEKQADIPQGSIPVFNPNGTAPSFIVEEEGKVIISLPGVPSELKWLFENEILPYLVKKFDLSEIIISRVLKVSRMGESMVDDKIGFLIEESQNPTIGLFAHPGQVDVRITAKAKNKTDARKLLAFISRPDINEMIATADSSLSTNNQASIPDDEFLKVGFKVLSDASGLAQFYDRDTNPELAKEGMKGFQEFMVKPDREKQIRKRIERARKRIYKN